MDNERFENVPVMWKPMEDKGEYFVRFIKLIEDKYKIKIDDYWDLHKWSVDNIAEFWAEIWDFTGIIYSRKYDQIVDLTVPMSRAPKWFNGARLNIAENLLRFKDNRVALIATGEDRETRVITYAEVYEETKCYASAFRKCRLKQGDRVVCYMSNREEAIFAMLGAVSVGAIFIGVLPMLGPQAVLDRVQQVRPNILVTIDRFRYNEKEIDMLSKIKVITKGLPTLERVIMVASKPTSTKKDISDISNSCFLEDFLELGREKDGSVPDIIFQQVPFSHPVFISHTSGTTGVPKALVHDCGCLLSVARDNWLYNDADRTINSLSMSPVGWVSWTLTVMCFIMGSKTVLFDGVPYFLSPTYFWDLIDEFGVSATFVTPGILDDLEKRGFVPTDKHNLSAFNMLWCSGSVVKPQNFDFVYNKIKKKIIFSSAYGSTELGNSMCLHRSLPIHRGEIPCSSLGVDLRCLDDEGKHVMGEPGELVIAKPTPALLSGIWGDTDGSIFRDTYFSKYTGKFAIGDLAVINPFTKGIIIFCRSDELLKPSGCRFGSTEIYNVVNKLPEIHDSICVSQYSKNRTERAVLFLKIRKEYVFNEELLKRVQYTIEKELTHRHVPGLIMEVPDIPYNMNGKKMEILVKKIINNMRYNPDVVINKECLDDYMKVPPYEV